jgi:hypothetical protein
MDRDGVEGKVRCLAGTGNRLPGARRATPVRQHSRRAESRAEDRREVAERIRHAGRNHRTHADEIKGKVGESLRENLEQLPLSKELATIRCDVELEFGPAVAAAWKNRTSRSAARVVHALRVQELVATAGCADDNRAYRRDIPARKQTRIRIIFRMKHAVKRWINAGVRRADRVRYRNHFSSNYMDAEIVGVSFAIETGRGRVCSACAQLSRRARSVGSRHGAGYTQTAARRFTRKENSASTSSTTCMCSPTTASHSWHRARHHAGVLRTQALPAARHGLARAGASGR